MSTIAATNLKNASSGSNNIVLGSDGSSTLSTAKITTLADSAGTNTSTPAEIASGRAKAWVNFNGTGTVAIRASYNVSSITDNGVGEYRVNFTNALVDANYSTVFLVEVAPSDVKLALLSSTAPTAAAVSLSVFRVIDTAGGGAARDAAYCNVAIFR